MKRRAVFYLISLFFSLLSTAPQANVVVLLHGYLGNAYSWESTNIVQTLRESGYQHAGILGYSPVGLVIQELEQGDQQGGKLYTLNLPSKSALLIQSDWLNAHLTHISQRHPNQSITLIAHSAGGVVARAALVRYPLAQVAWLITIASPHQGTGRAYEALAATNSNGWFGGMKSWLVRREIGNDLYYALKGSRHALFDLTPPRPGNLLYWLNQQPHPAIRYTSIIRGGSYHMPGDFVVPPYSQDLCLLPQTAPNAERYISSQGHLLSFDDGALLRQLLQIQGLSGVDGDLHGLQKCSTLFNG